MVQDVPLVIPEVNPAHIEMLEEQGWRKESGGYIVANGNCSAIGLVLALRPLEDKFGIESLFVSTMQAISGAGYPGVSSLDILGNVVPFIKNEEEKMQEEVGKMLGSLDGNVVKPLPAKVSAHCNRVAVEDGHMECVSIKFRKPATYDEIVAAWESFQPFGPTGMQFGVQLPTAPLQPVEYEPAVGPSAASAGPHARQRHGDHRGPVASVLAAGLEVHAAQPQHAARRSGCGGAERGAAGRAGQAQVLTLPCRALGSGCERAGAGERMSEARRNIVVMKFGGTSVEDAVAIRRTAGIVAGRARKGLQPVVVVSAMAKVTDQLLAAAAAAFAGRGDRDAALEISTRLRARHLNTAADLCRPDDLRVVQATIDSHFDSLDELLRGVAAVGELTARTSDLVVSFGERLSSVMVAAAFAAEGLASTHIDAREVIRTDDQHGKAAPDEKAIERELAQRVLPLLDQGRVPVLGGFIGSNAEGATTTLGRGGPLGLHGRPDRRRLTRRRDRDMDRC